MNKLCFFDRKRKFIRAFRSRAHKPAGFLVLSSTNKKHRQSGACLMVACLHETRTKDTNIFQGSRKVLQSKSFLGKGATRVSGTVFVVRQKLANGAELRRGGGAGVFIDEHSSKVCVSPLKAASISFSGMLSMLNG